MVLPGEEKYHFDYREILLILSILERRFSEADVNLEGTTIRVNLSMDEAMTLAKEIKLATTFAEIVKSNGGYENDIVG